MIELRIKIEGDKELRRLLTGWTPVQQRRITRPGIAKASRVVSRAVKEAAPVESGLLKRSIGVKMVTYKNTGTVVGIVGPRRGYKRIVAVVDGRTQAFTRANVERLGSRGPRRLAWRDPAKYAHLVHGGTAPHRIARIATQRRREGPPRPYVVNHPGAKANPFLRRAWFASMPEARAVMVKSIRQNLVKEARRMLRKQRLVA